LARRLALALFRSASEDDIEDAVGEGILELAEAVEAYDPARGTPFHSYASMRLRSRYVEIRHASSAGSQHAKEHAARLRARGIDPASPGILPEDVTQAKKLRMRPSTVADGRRTACVKPSVSLDSLMTDHPLRPPELSKDRHLLDRAQCTDPGPDLLCESRWTRETVRQAVSELPTTERLAVIFHEFEGMDMTETAEALEVSVTALRKILRSARETLRERLSDLA
jgi:RNA polymerase sigma factor (sigma-70 family)